MTKNFKYLTFTPWKGQLNNSRMSLETAIVFAELLGRKLIMPNNHYRYPGDPILEGDNWKPLHPAACYDLSAFNNIIVNKSLLSNDTRIYLPFKPGTSVFCYPKIPNDRRQLTQFAAGRTNFIELTSRIDKYDIINLSEGLLEVFYTFFYADATTTARYKLLIRDGFEFHNIVYQEALKIIAQLQPYNAIHIRRGDFIHKFNDRNLPINEIIKTVYNHFDPAIKLYIATDETNKQFFAPLLKIYDAVFIGDYNKDNVLFPEMLGCVEQLICAHAEKFIGTKLSTFSSYITRLRGYNNMQNKDILFTDRTEERILDNKYNYSWVNWLKAGEPIWGREYREGYE